MPKTLYVGKGENSGVDVTYIKSRRVLYIGGWYDSIVGISGQEIPLAEFLTELGITLKDCARAMAEKEGASHACPF